MLTAPGRGVGRRTGWGRSAGRRRLKLGLGLGLGLGLQLGPCTCDSAAALVLRCRACCPMAPSRLKLGLRAAYSGISSVAGFSIFFVWTVVYRQPGTAAMGGLAGILGGAGRAGMGLGWSCQLLRTAAGAALSPGRERCLPRRGHWQRRPRVPGHCSGLWDLMPSERGAT